MVRRSIAFFTYFFISFSGVAAHANVESDEVYARTYGASSFVNIADDLLLVSHSAPAEILLLDVSGDEAVLLKHVSLLNGITGQDIHPSGWAAVCTEQGQRIVYFNAKNPAEAARSISLPPTQYLACSSVSLTVDAWGHPVLWTGSVGTSEIVAIDLLQARILQRFRGVSGPHTIVNTATHLFALNGRMNPFDGLPLALNKASGRDVVGDRRGFEIPGGLRRGYAPTIFSDPVGSWVYFISMIDQQIHALNRERPSLSTVWKMNFGSLIPRDLTRSGDCLVALGQFADVNRTPGIAFYELAGGTGQPKEVLTLSLAAHPTLFGGIRFDVDSRGRFYIASPKGITRLEGDLPREGCQAFRWM